MNANQPKPLLVLQPGSRSRSILCRRGPAYCRRLQVTSGSTFFLTGVSLRCGTGSSVRLRGRPGSGIIAVEVKVIRQIVLYPGEDGYWVAECPSLPGCISQGKTREEAITNIREAIEAYVEDVRENGERVPEDHLDRLTVIV